MPSSPAALRLHAMGILRRLFETSAADIWHGVRRRISTPQDSRSALRVHEPVERAFLESEAYTRLMSIHLPYPGRYDEHEAQNQTRNYRFRHHEVQHQLGVFRWRGIQKHLREVLALVDAEGRRVVDLGGAACPVGLRTQVVDQLETDALGRPVLHHDLDDVPDELDGVFTSHTLEHVAELDGLLDRIRAKLRPGGTLIAHVPAFTCERWRAGQHSNTLYNDHLWTFGLEADPKPQGLIGYRDIDVLIRERFELRIADRCGDDSLFLLATRA